MVYDLSNRVDVDTLAHTGRNIVQNDREWRLVENRF